MNTPKHDCDMWNYVVIVGSITLTCGSILIVASLTAVEHIAVRAGMGLSGLILYCITALHLITVIRVIREHPRQEK